jgi:hypothetical protein
MSDDQIRTLREQLDRIERALVGDPDHGHRGLVKRMDNNEAKIEGIDRKLILWGGIVTGVSLSLSYLKNTFLK